MQIAALNRLFRWSAIAGALALATGLVTTSQGRLSPRKLPGGLQSPILALELMRTADVINQLAPPNHGGSQPGRDDRAQLRRAVHVDFAFIAAYASFFVVTGVLMLGLWPRAPVGALVALFGIGAALFDVRENLAMLNALSGGADIPRWDSLWKWRLLFAASLLAVPIFVDHATPLFRRTLGYLGALLGIIACVQGSFATYEQNDQLLESAAGNLSGMFIFAVIFLATRCVLGNGLLPALDRLATWPVFAWLRDWPAKDDDEIPSRRWIRDARSSSSR